MLLTFRLSRLGYGGTERVFLSIADYLSVAYGYRIDFVVDDVSGSETELVAIEKGYRVIGLEAARTWKSVLPFRRYLRQARPDLVLSAYTETNAAVLMANVVNGLSTRVVVTEHASLDEHWADKSFARRLMLEVIVRYVYRLASHVLCVSQGMAVQLGRRLEQSKVGFIHNPVRFAERRYSWKDARRLVGLNTEIPLILAVGRIARPKNYTMLLRAFKVLLQEGDYQLCIVGGVFDPNEKGKLDQFIEENNLGSAVKFFDYTNDVHIFYEAADVLALSSAWEGFGNVLVEGLAFGLPIVSTRCNFGPAEILENGVYGILVDVDNYEAMAYALHEVLENNPFDPGRQRERATNFSESMIGEAYHQLFLKIIRSEI